MWQTLNLTAGQLRRGDRISWPGVAGRTVVSKGTAEGGRLAVVRVQDPGADRQYNETYPVGAAVIAARW